MSQVLQFESLEGLEDFLKNTEEGKSFLTNLISATHIEQSKLSGLLINRDKLLEEKKALQENYKVLEENYKNIEKKIDNDKEEDYIRLKEEEKKWIESANNNSDKSVNDVALSTELSNLKLKLATAEKNADKIAQQSENLMKEKEDEIKKISSSFEEVLISNALNEELDTTNINPLHRRMLTRSFRGGASVELDTNGNRSVVMLNESDGVRIPIHDWFTGWAADETAKLYINPPSNSGGGSSSGKGFSKDNIEDLTKQYMEFQSTGRTQEGFAIMNRIKSMQKQLLK